MARRWSLPRIIEGWVEDLLLASIPGPRPARKLHHLVPRGITRKGVVLEQHIREGRFQRSLALVAGASGLLAGAEVALEHYRGSYGQRVMYAPLVTSPLLVAGGVGALYHRGLARTLLPTAGASMLGVGLAGFVYHVRGVARKPGGWRIPVFNVVMGPPLFAPLLLGVPGLLGLVAAGLRREDDPPAWPTRAPWHGLRRGPGRRFTVWSSRAREGRLRRVLAAATGVSALLNGFEALYSHYKNAFSHPTEYIPVASAPLIAAAAFAAVGSDRAARGAMPVASAAALVIGTAGFGLHLRGVFRRARETRKVAYNLVYGPPALAPLLFAATGFLGLVATQLRRD